MANTYTLISSVTVGASGASSIDFTSIPSTYTDLKLVVSSRTNRTAVTDDYVEIQFNGATTNRAARFLYGLGSAGVGSYSESNIYAATNANTTTANTFGSTEFYIPNYAGSNNKSLSADGAMETNATQSVLNMVAGLWSVTSAITSIKLIPYASTTWLQYTTAYLYGIKNS